MKRIKNLERCPYCCDSGTTHGKSCPACILGLRYEQLDREYRLKVLKTEKE